ncbi:CHAT domain-containing protein, partial [Frankia sp. AvcI1]
SRPRPGSAGDQGTPYFPALPSTRSEGQAIADLLAVAPLLGTDALKGFVADVRSPLVLHLATHGLFLPEPTSADTSHYETFYVLDVPGEGVFPLAGEFPAAAETPAGLPATGTDPLLRSALALAGINTWLSGGATPPSAIDGMLTADDVCALDLRHTRLVVLSACETGLGANRREEGVVGLRWAFAAAGARAVVTSLWRVADSATADLMTTFYQRLLDGAPVPVALRDAQTGVRDRFPDPYLWGAFVCHGDPAALLR